MNVELTIKSLTNNNIRTVQFPIYKDNLLQELQYLGDEYIIIGITVDNKKIL